MTTVPNIRSKFEAKVDEIIAKGSADTKDLQALEVLAENVLEASKPVLVDLSKGVESRYKDIKFLPSGISSKFYEDIESEYKGIIDANVKRNVAAWRAGATALLTAAKMGITGGDPLVVIQGIKKVITDTYTAYQVSND